MAKRELRAVLRIGEAPHIGVCLSCNRQFRATSGKEFTKKDATRTMQAEFDAHECMPLDNSQNALRIALEATRKQVTYFSTIHMP